MDPALLLVAAVLALAAVALGAAPTWLAWGRSDAQRDRADAATAAVAAGVEAALRAQIASLERAAEAAKAARADAAADARGVLDVRDRVAVVAGVPGTGGSLLAQGVSPATEPTSGPRPRWRPPADNAAPVHLRAGRDLAACGLTTPFNTAQADLVTCPACRATGATS